MKVKLGVRNCLNPMPTILVGALVNGKSNYVTIAHVGIMEPQAVSLGMNKEHFSNVGIKENRTFSVNIPSTRMVVETDYCGLTSGKSEDKTKLFTTFYGPLKTAPMIEECAINIFIGALCKHTVRKTSLPRVRLTLASFSQSCSCTMIEVTGK